MKIIITENHYKKILLESSKGSLDSIISNIKKFFAEVVKQSNEDERLLLSSLTTWGAGIGGMLMPLNEYIHTGNFHLNDFQMTCILFAAGALLYDEEKSNVDKIIKIIKEQNVYSEFKAVLKKGEELKSVFLNFMNSLNITLSNVTNMMSYAFIIPILNDIWSIAQNQSITMHDVQIITMRILAFKITTLSKNAIRELINKLIIRFRS